MLVTVGAVGWAVRDQAARQEELERDRAGREAALDAEVNRLVALAEAHIEDSRWQGGEREIDRAERLLRASSREMPQSLLGLKRDLAFVESVEAIYARPKSEEFWDGQELDDAYAQAFREHGIDVTALQPTDAAQRIRARPIRRELARALDHWSAMCRRISGRTSVSWEQLLLIAKSADPDQWRNQLRQEYRLGNREGLEALATAIDLEQQSAQTLHLLGRALYDAGSRSTSEGVLRRAHVQYPDDWWINSLLGWACLDSSDAARPEEALRFFTAAQAARPRNPYNLRRIIEILHRRGEWDEASRWCRRGIALFEELARNAPDNRRYAVELDALQQQLEANLWLAGKPHEANAARVGMDKARREKSEKAIEEYTKLLLQDPGHIAARHRRADEYAKLKLYGQAARDYAELVKRGPNSAPVNDPKMWYQYALVCLAGKDHDALRDVCARMLARFGKHTDFPAVHHVAWTCGLTANCCADLPQVLMMSERLVRNEPGRWQLIAHGIVLFRLGRHEEAKRQFKASVELPEDGGHPSDWLFLAMVCHRLGQKNEAQEWFDKAASWLAKPPDYPWPQILQFQLLRNEAESQFQDGTK
jgi:tetratricopeptide (TPR) repeat protein